MTMPAFAVLDDVLIPVDEIKYARIEPKPGIMDGPEMLVINWKSGGHLCFPDSTVTDLIKAITREAKLRLPD